MTNQKRLDRERKTIQLMIEIYCRENHHTAGELCENCRQLESYAMQRIDKCPYHDDKPTCASCPIHCYKPDMRAAVRRVMRYAGPRMVVSHPILTIRHYMDALTNRKKK
ncbi:MAG TPA: nitrous oxide-stimulated promoter family protein [Anaerolineaceae bacterium]|nr:nitrous oxide-stimulated promoter family protein [Anaerolineaceae bacterium]